MFIKTKKFITYNNKLNHIAKDLRNNMTIAEKKLWYEFLRGHRYRFARQKVIGNYILDFYCQKLKLGIEVDGETHLGDRNEEYDEIRAKKFNELGVEIIRFWNHDILKGLGEVESIIENEINPLNPVRLSSRRSPFTRGTITPPDPPLKGGIKGGYPSLQGGRNL